MEITTSYEGSSHIQAGKVYPADVIASEQPHTGYLIQFKDEAGHIVLANTKKSAHIGGQDWEIIGEPE